MKRKKKKPLSPEHWIALLAILVQVALWLLDRLF